MWRQFWPNFIDGCPIHNLVALDLREIRKKCSKFTMKTKKKYINKVFTSDSVLFLHFCSKGKDKKILLQIIIVNVSDRLNLRYFHAAQIISCRCPKDFDFGQFLALSENFWF